MFCGPLLGSLRVVSVIRGRGAITLVSEGSVDERFGGRGVF
jgi:hypothetical protein